VSGRVNKFIAIVAVSKIASVDHGILTAWLSGKMVVKHPPGARAFLLPWKGGGGANLAQPIFVFSMHQSTTGDF
jgi:hypothetical protein